MTSSQKCADAGCMLRRNHAARGRREQTPRRRHQRTRRQGSHPRLSRIMADEQILDGFMLKPMNCPHHIKHLRQPAAHSYRDLPVRLAEFGTVYRWEQSRVNSTASPASVGSLRTTPTSSAPKTRSPPEVLGCLEPCEESSSPRSVMTMTIACVSACATPTPQQISPAIPPKTGTKPKPPAVAAAATLGVAVHGGAR